MSRTLIIPAAGRGSRLQSDLPKVLYPVAGRAMIDHLLDLYSDVVDRFVLVLSPEFHDVVLGHCSSLHRFAGRFDYTIQEQPDGMLPAILTAAPVVAGHQLASVWITWCDQIAVRRGTVRRLLELSGGTAGLVLPTVRKTDPYIHFERDAANRITAVLHRREGDVMPAIGESDSGLFALSRSAYLEDLPQFASEPVKGAGAATGERNFLPFIPWMAQRGEVLTFPLEDEIEALGVNTAADARSIEERIERHV
jgi:bifunctional UDP-N-acetylglucosamine pyrophosphorylase/glucosamine-1-phosphate N-acetyltransferase